MVADLKNLLELADLTVAGLKQELIKQAIIEATDNELMKEIEKRGYWYAPQKIYMPINNNEQIKIECPDCKIC